MARRRGLRRQRFQEAHRILRKERSGQRDVYCPLSKIGFEMGAPMGPVHERYEARIEDEGKTRTLALAPTAVAQLSAVAGVPRYFLERVPPALGLKLFRCMLDVAAGEKDPTYLLRLQEGRSPKIRAMLPASFVRISDRELLEDLERSTAGRPLTITNLYVSEDVFSIRTVFSEEVTDIGTSRHPDPMMPGLDLRASETGVYPLQVRRLVFREVCSNGVTSISDMHKVYRKRMASFDRAEFRAGLRAGVEESIQFGKDVTERLTVARTDTLHDTSIEVARVFRKYKLGSPRGERARWVTAELLRNASLFGVGKFELVQAFTGVARGLEHDNRLRWEDAMADYLLTSVGSGDVPSA